MNRDISPDGNDTGQKPRKIPRLELNDDDSGVSASGSDADSQSDSRPVHPENNRPVYPENSRPVPIENSRPMPPENVDNSNNEENRKDPLLEEIENKSDQLAHFIINRVLADNSTKNIAPDEVEAALLRCVNTMMTKHEILFKGMMKRLNINDETAYNAFLTVVNELFEGEHVIVDWGKIIALYSFGGQLALYCKEKELKECGPKIPIFVGRYARDVISTFILKKGGWKKLCEEFPPEDDMDRRVWKFLTWTAVGLGLATAASFFTSR